MRLIFAGTPEFAAHQLTALVEQGHEVLAVYTQPDRPAGRGKRLTASPVKKLALTYDIPLFQPTSLKSKEVQEQIVGHQADAMVVVAYGLILPQAVLDIPRFGCFNIHGSLLPRWRGAAPIQRAIEAGDKTTGITIMQMDAGLDTGDMLLAKSCAIDPMETSGSLHNKLMTLGGEVLLETLQQVAAKQLCPQPQDDSLANYAEKIDKAEAQINWRESAIVIDRKIRAFNPFPCAYTFLNGQRLKIHQAQVVSSSSNTQNAQPSPGEIIGLNGHEQGIEVSCAEGVLGITQLQLPGKKPASVESLLNGHGDLFRSGLHFD